MTNNSKLTIAFRSGFISLVVLGSLLHFVFQWTGNSPFIAWFVAINESVWEHLKLGYGALILFSLIEYPLIKDEVNNYLLSKVVGLIILSATIIFLFYFYTYFTSRSIIWVDISLYISASFLAQVVIDKIYRMDTFERKYQKLAIIFAFAIVVLFTVFTYYPPDLSIFIAATN